MKKLSLSASLVVIALVACIVLITIVAASRAQSAPAGWANAQWIWDEPDANNVAQTNEPRYLRLAFTLAAKPSAAELWATADNVYVAYVNGQKVGNGKDWAIVNKFDVAKHLVVGKNVVAIQATNQGGVAGAIARLHVNTADKKDLFIATNDKTKITRTLSKGWTNADFDDAAWFNAIVLGDTSIGPWNIGESAVAQKGKGKGKGNNDRFGYGFNQVDANVKTRLTPQEQLKHFVVPKDFVIELVAADPVIINPITMVMDDKGRIIVSESHTYRYGPPGSPIKPYANPVVRLDPDGKGGFTRTLIADGFADPVMGIAVKGDKLWLTANNYLYTYDIPESPGTAVPGPGDKQKPLATNKKTIVTDLNKAWNPFGMFVLEWGPDGKLYMSVGNHAINLQSADKDKLASRGGSGMIMRMNPDGTKMERLVHGLRVPYSFEMDPFGQLWLLSNGEGNPDRFVRVIEGVDYHCYSRPGVDNNWLAGNHPLAPPTDELHGGAHTQLMRYYAAAYPAEFQGNLFCCNWGRHGFAGANRGIFRFITDDRNNVVKKETLVACTDPHFRPSHIILDQDGSLLIADWYGRDDESDMTGRIWRLKYVGKDAPVVKHKLDSAEWKEDRYAISALGSPDHLIREKAVLEISRRMAKETERIIENPKNPKGKTFAANSLFAFFLKAEPLGAANAVRILANSPLGMGVAASGGLTHGDWRVRKLATRLVGQKPETAKIKSFADTVRKRQADTIVQRSRTDASSMVRLEGAIMMSRNGAVDGDVVGALLNSLDQGAAADTHFRYEAAWHLAKHADAETISKLLTSDDANIRLAGLIAIDVACYENKPSKKAALAALAKALENPGKLDHQLLLMVAQLDGDASIVTGLEKLIARDDLPTATIAKAVLVLKAKAGGSLTSAKLSAAAGKRLIEAVEKGSLKIASPADQLVIFEFLESEGPTPFALKQIEGQLRSTNKELKLAAHTLARRFGPKARSLADPLWPSVLNPKTKFEDAIDSISTLARLDGANRKWLELYAHEDPYIRMETVRWSRHLSGKIPFEVGGNAKDLLAKDSRIADDLAMANLGGISKELNLPAREKDKDTLGKYAVDELAKMPAADHAKRAAMGLQVFERGACTKCHTTATATTPLAPSLRGIASQKVDYLIESVLYPSKIIKTGFESEIIELKNGKTITGLVKDEGKHYRVLGLDKNELIAKSDVESRSVSRVSVMPDGQEAVLSRREFVDLIAYLQTLK